MNATDHAVSSTQQDNNVRYFFTPRSVAVVGASNNKAKGGYKIVDNLKRNFSGEIYPVNPRDPEIAGLKAYRQVRDIPGEVDLAIILIGAQMIPDVLEQCVEKGVKAAIIEAGGFADAGPEGRKLQERILEIARPAGLRIWGPNCAGHIVVDPPMSSAFIVETSEIPQGNVNFIAQSGMLAAALLVQMISTDAPKISAASTIGNKADVDESDLLEYFKDDPRSEVFGFYLESIVDGRRFTKLLRETTKTKPCVVLKAGRTDLGARAAASHTGSLVGNDKVADAMLRQYGVTRVDDFIQLLNFCKGHSMLRDKPLKGKRIAVLTQTGGSGVTCSDQMGLLGLELAEYSPETIARLKEIFPAWLEPKNPTDIWSTLEQHGLTKTQNHCLDAILADPNVDGVLNLPIAFDFFDDTDFQSFVEIANKYDKPVVTWLIGDEHRFEKWVKPFEQGNLPVFRDLVTCVRVMRASFDWYQWTQRAAEVERSRAQSVPIPASVEQLFAKVRAEGRNTLTEAEGKQVLAAFDIPVTKEVLATRADEAAEIAERLGYPVVLKLSSPDILHKTEYNAIRLGLRDAQSVRTAFDEIIATVRERAPQARIEGCLVQEQVSGGVEVIVGSTNDSQFGPTVLFGLGGILVEVMGDVSLRLAPLAQIEAEQMVREIKGFKVLEGVRGQGPADIDALIQTIVKVSRMVSALEPHFAELDINPLMVLPAGKGVRAVDALLTLR